MITIENLVKKYGPLTAIDDLNLTIPAGQFFGFLGPNGAGKTTTIKILAGLLKQTSGKVTVGGYDLEHDAFEAKKLIGYIPDKPFIYERLTGQEFLEFVSRLYHMDWRYSQKKIAEYLDMFRLTASAHDLIEGYSHGMKQKLVMSSALLHDPKVIIVDEPMVGLDPEGARLVKRIFRDCVRRGVTIFMSTHTLAIAQQLCDRIVIIQKGKIRADGTFEDLKKLSQSKSDELEDVFLELTSDHVLTKLAEFLSTTQGDEKK